MQETVRHGWYDGTGGSAPERYERWFVPVVSWPLAERLIAAVGLREGERVLDVACGTGIAARLAAEAVGASGSVTGVDQSRAMLEVARALAPAIEWREGDADALPVPDTAFDAVLCHLGLMFFPDRAAALREMRRVLVDGGRLALNVPGPLPPMFAVLAEALARRVGPEAAGFVGAIFSLHDVATLRDLATGAGFAAVEVGASTRALRLPPPADFLWQYLHATPLVAAVSKLDDDEKTALERDVVARWAPFVDGDELVLDVRVVEVAGRR